MPDSTRRGVVTEELKAVPWDSWRTGDYTQGVAAAASFERRYVTLAPAHDDGCFARQVHHTRRLESAVSAVDDEIHGMLQPPLDLLRVRHRNHLAREQQCRAHDRL